MINRLHISVAMATYNGEKYIKEQLDSILEQLSSDDELIISDDGSTDKTLDIINSYSSPLIKIYKGPRKGVIKNFENAIEKCSNEIIFLSDQDDIWQPNKVEEITTYFNNNKDCILIVHDNVMINENKKVINESFFNFRKVKNGLFSNIIKNSFIGCCMAFRSELKNKILPIPASMPMHDQWIGLIAILNGRVDFINKKLILYRRHESNTSSFKRNSIFIMFKNRVNLVRNLIKRGK